MFIVYRVLEMKLGFASGCFLERRKGFVVPHEIPEDVKSYPVELQVGRGYDYTDFGEVVSIHLPFTLYGVQTIEGITVYRKLRGINIACLDEEQWKMDLKLFKSCIKEAAERNVKYAVFHYGGCDCDGNPWRDERHRRLHWKREKEFLIEISELAASKDIQLLSENHPYGDGIFLNHIKHITKIVEGGYAGVCLDFPHAYWRFTRFGDASLNDIINRFRESIQEVHLADSDGSSHAPLALDRGRINWRKLLSKLKDPLLVIIELRENPLESLRLVQKYCDEEPRE